MNMVPFPMRKMMFMNTSISANRLFMAGPLVSCEQVGPIFFTPARVRETIDWLETMDALVDESPALGGRRVTSVFAWQ